MRSLLAGGLFVLFGCSLSSPFPAGCGTPRWSDPVVVPAGSGDEVLVDIALASLPDGDYLAGSALDDREGAPVVVELGRQSP